MQQPTPPSPTTPAVLFDSSCTPMRQGFYQALRSDFRAITDDDAVNADCLRYFENATNQRIKFLKERHNVPDGHLPSEDALWLEAPLRAIETGTQHAHGKSTYARCLEDASRVPEDNENQVKQIGAKTRKRKKPRTLIELGYLRKRYIARWSGREAHPITTEFMDERGPFIVTSQGGDYMGDDGLTHNAIDEGYSSNTSISRQFLYEIDAVNAALAKSAWQSPPEVKPRWEISIPTKKSGIDASANFRSSQEADAYPAQDSSQTQATREGTTRMVGESSSINQNIMETGYMSTSSNDIPNNIENSDVVARSAEELRYAPWTPETIIGLSSAVLDVPDPTSPKWQEDWYEPAQRLIEATNGIDPRYAWERIDCVIRFMATPGSPSWWQLPKEQGGRKTKKPVTLRNVADNHAIQFDAYNAIDWYPETTTPYEGPPLLLQELGMSQEEVEIVQAELLREFPYIKGEILRTEKGRLVISIHSSDTDRILLEYFNDWYDIDPSLMLSIEQAAEYGKYLLEQAGMPTT